MIQQKGHMYNVYSKAGKLFGRYTSRKKAEKRLKQMEYFKHIGQKKR